MKSSMSYEDIVDDLRVNAASERPRRTIITTTIRDAKVKIWRTSYNNKFTASADDLNQWVMDAPFTLSGLRRIKRAAKEYFDTCNTERVTWRLEVE